MSDNTKLQQLILYFATRSENDPAFGATKLNKLLYFADFLCFRATGSSITGEPYQKLEFGPSPTNMLPILDDMRKKNLCVEVQRNHYGKPQRRVVAQVDADLSAFSASEIEIANQILRDLQDHSATQVSELSHLEIGWKAAALQEDIPYVTSLIGDPLPPTDEEIAFGQRLAQIDGEVLQNL